jgi:hypothetical protein
MKVRFLKSVCAISIFFGSGYLFHAQQSGDVLTLDKAVNEAIVHNLDFFAQKYDLSIAEAQIVTAKLRPNPLQTLDRSLGLAGHRLLYNCSAGQDAQQWRAHRI